MTSTIFTYFTFILTSTTLSQSCTTKTSDSVPPSPSITVNTGSLAPAVTPGYSELVDTYTMDTLSNTITGWPRINCPHEQSNLLNWHDSATWTSTSLGRVPISSDPEIQLPPNSKVIIRDCTFNSIVNTAVLPYQRITIPATSELIFDGKFYKLYNFSFLYSFLHFYVLFYRF